MCAFCDMGSLKIVPTPQRPVVTCQLLVLSWQLHLPTQVSS